MAQENENQIVTRATLAPSAELRKALDGIKDCKDFFEALGVVEYLETVNNEFLQGRGKVNGPVAEILMWDKPPEHFQEEILGLEDPAASVRACIDWEEDSLVKTVSIRLRTYTDTYNSYSLQLYAAGNVKDPNKHGVYLGRSIQRDFSLRKKLNKQEIRQTDDLLLTFTEDLLMLKYLKI